MFHLEIGNMWSEMLMVKFEKCQIWIGNHEPNNEKLITRH